MEIEKKEEEEKPENKTVVDFVNTLRLQLHYVREHDCKLIYCIEISRPNINNNYNNSKLFCV